MKRLLIVLALLLPFMGVGAVAGGVASAHSDLVSTSPEDGATLTEAPTELVFTFSEPLLPDFVRFIATDSAGSTADLQVTAVDGAVAVVGWPETFPAGEWRVEYRVVSQDGHPVNGGITFTYAGSSPSPSPTPTPEPTVEPTSDPAPAPSESTVTPASPTPEASTESPETTPVSDSSSNVGWIVAAVAVVILAAVVIIGLIARSRSSSSP